MSAWRAILSILFLIEAIIDFSKAVKAAEHQRTKEAIVRTILFFLFCNCVVGSLVLGAD